MSSNEYVTPECTIFVNEIEGVLCSSPVKLPDSIWFDEEEI